MTWDDEPDDCGDETDACPHCGAEIYFDAEQCPRCGKYVSEEDGPAEPRKWWVVITAVICLVLAIAWALGLM